MAYLNSPRLWGGVRLVPRPAPENVRRLDLGALPLINAMHQEGIYLDCRGMEILGYEIHNEIEVIEDQIRSAVGHDLNPESGPQVAQLLFKDMGLEPPGGMKRTRGGAESTVDEVLSTLKDENPIVGRILAHRALVKLLGTYVDRLPRMVDEGSRLHTTFSATRTATGRLASSNPNLQNIPIRSAYGKRIRDSFQATPGADTTLVSVDLSQIEMVWAAHLSQDPIMMGIFERGEDIHTRTTLSMFRLPESAVEQPDFKTKYRLPAKTLGFGVLYGVTARGLTQQIAAAGGPRWTVEATDRFIDDWFSIYDGVYRWMELQHARDRRYGMVWDAFGRVRWIPEIYSVHYGIRNAGLREAGNMPIQSSAQGTIKLAMAELAGLVTEYRRRYNITCRPLLQIHDELLFEISRSAAEEWGQIVRDIMIGAAPLSIPVRAGIEIGDQWGDLK